MHKNLYIIAGCNGSGKTTASYTVLPEILNCHEFVNADEIAKGLSPFNPDSAGIQAGRLMLARIKYLLNKGMTFAFETTLATKSYTTYVQQAQAKGYKVKMVFLYLESDNLAIDRVATRVKEGGHNIPVPVIKRRYRNGLKNFFNLYSGILDEWTMVDSSHGKMHEIARFYDDKLMIQDNSLWELLYKKYYEGK